MNYKMIPSYRVDIPQCNKKDSIRDEVKAYYKQWACLEVMGIFWSRQNISNDRVVPDYYA